MPPVGFEPTILVSERPQRFRNNDEVIAAVQSWIHKQPKTFF
jgi:hypothetical protein